MVDPAAVRRIALTLPDAQDTSDDEQLSFNVGGGKGFAWSWKERIHPKKPRVPRLDVLAVRCVPEEKDFLLEIEPTKFFTEPHYNGYPAILVRLAEVDEAELKGLLTVAHRCVTQAKPRRRRA
jgi:hypothetical protein